MPWVLAQSTDLKFLFRAVAVLELGYAVVGLMPPSLVHGVTGWVLTADGHWLTKLLAVALASQAWVAWTLRDEPHLGVAKGLAFYQIASATVDWVMWILMADQDIFSNPTARLLVIAAIPSHYVLGFLLVLAIRRVPERRLAY